MDWAPPAGLPGSSISRPRSGGTSNPFAFGPLSLGQLKSMELPETVEVPSTLQKIGSVSADVGFSKQGEKPKSLKALKDLPKT